MGRGSAMTKTMPVITSSVEGSPGTTSITEDYFFEGQRIQLCATQYDLMMWVSDLCEAMRSGEVSAMMMHPAIIEGISCSNIMEILELGDALIRISPITSDDMAAIRSASADWQLAVRFTDWLIGSVLPGHPRRMAFFQQYEKLNWAIEKNRRPMACDNVVWLRPT